MTTLAITSRNLGYTYNEADSVRGFAVIEKLVGFAGAALHAIRNVRLGGATLRQAQA